MPALFDAPACQRTREDQQAEVRAVREIEPQQCKADPHHAYARVWGRMSTRLCVAHQGVYRFLTQHFAEGFGAAPELSIVGLLVGRYLCALPLRALPRDPDEARRLLLVAWSAFRRNWRTAYATERLALQRLESPLLDAFERELREEARQHHLDAHITDFALHLFLTVVRVVTEQCADLRPPYASHPPRVRH